MKTKVYNLLVLLIVLLLLTSCAQPHSLQHETGFKTEGMIYSLKEARVISKENLIKELAEYPVIFLGDFHSSDFVHRFSADLIEALGKEYRVHLANEWFSPDQNEQLSFFLEKKLDKNEFLKKVGWKERIGYQYESFESIYTKLQSVKGEMYGINLSEEERSRISLLQTEQMNEDERRFYESLDMDVTIHQKMVRPYLSHCHAPLKDEDEQKCIERMYRVQVAWDEKMGQESALLAKNVLQGPKDKLIVFIGAMHLSSGLGANMRFARYSHKPFVTILPCVKRRVEQGLADYLYYVDPLKVE